MKAKIITPALWLALGATFCWFVIWNGLKAFIPMALIFAEVAALVYRYETR